MAVATAASGLSITPTIKGAPCDQGKIVLEAGLGSWRLLRDKGAQDTFVLSFDVPFQDDPKPPPPSWALIRFSCADEVSWRFYRAKACYSTTAWLVEEYQWLSTGWRLHLDTGCLAPKGEGSATISWQSHPWAYRAVLATEFDSLPAALEWLWAENGRNELPPELGGLSHESMVALMRMLSDTLSLISLEKRFKEQSLALSACGELLDELLVRRDKDGRRGIFAVLLAETPSVKYVAEECLRRVEGIAAAVSGATDWRLRRDAVRSSPRRH